jgi:hypothetical protein
MIGMAAAGTLRAARGCMLLHDRLRAVVVRGRAIAPTGRQYPAV